MENQMLRLKAFGVFLPGDMTPYHNENIFLEEQRHIYSIDKSIQLLDDKISIIKHFREEKAAHRRALIEKILATFGVVSILCDSLGLLEMLLTDSDAPHLFRFAFSSELILLTGIFLVSSLLMKKK